MFARRELGMPQAATAAVQKRVCCCGTPDGRCCGKGCCLTPASRPAPVNVPVRSESVQELATIALNVSAPLDAGDDDGHGRRAGAPDVAGMLSFLSLQSQHVRIQT